MGVPVGADCAPLVAGPFLFCCRGNFMLSLSDDGWSGVIEAFNSASRCLDGLLGIDNTFFDSMVHRIYPSGLLLDKANVSDTEASFLDLHLSISDGFVKTKIFDKWDGLGFSVVFPFLDGDVPRSASCGVCVSRLVRFARVSGRVDGFGARSGVLTAKLLRQGYGCRGLRRAFSEFYRRHFYLVSGCSVGLKTLLLQDLSGPGFCGGLVCRFGRVRGGYGFPCRFGRMVFRCRGIGCGMGVLRRAACLVVGPVGVDGFACLFGCATVGRASS